MVVAVLSQHRLIEVVRVISAGGRVVPVVVASLSLSCRWQMCH